MRCKDYEQLRRDKKIVDDGVLKFGVKSEEFDRSLSESIELRNMMEAHKVTCQTCNNLLA
jgi:succinate dehydrogenase/fumarate reductase flavoprotein subunit